MHLTYQTAFVDNAGKLQMRNDVYNLDSRTLAAIKHERSVVEPAEPKREQQISSGSSASKAVRPARVSTKFQSVSDDTSEFIRPAVSRSIYR